jgi:tetratricopeptide (TPR) repeat protein
MPARFCPQCGTPALAGAKFCCECGTSLTGAAAPASDGWRVTTIGSAALATFLVGGLAIWAAILTPDPPRPAPGAGGGRPAAQAAAPGAPVAPVTIPAEAKAFIDDLAAQAKEKPDDVPAWVRLGQVAYRAAQLEPSYYAQALSAFRHVLEREPENTDALRGIANVHFDREEAKEAITYYDRYLEFRPDDASARTALAAMYVATGESQRGLDLLRAVVRTDDAFWPAHYYLGVTLGQQGDKPAALAELQRARELAPDDGIRRQIDQSIAGFGGTPPAPGTSPAPAPPAPPRSPFQTAVEDAFRAHPIMGPRIVRFAWTGAATGQVVVQNFPMEGMPPAVREKFAARLADTIRQAQAESKVDGPVRMEIADAASGTVMATVTP